MKLSRRGFLIGAGAAVVTAAVAPVQAYADDWVAEIIELHRRTIREYRGPFYFLHPTQWERFERDGFDMRLCKLIEPIPRTDKGDIWKASDPVSRAR